MKFSPIYPPRPRMGKQAVAPSSTHLHRSAPLRGHQDSILATNGAVCWWTVNRLDEHLHQEFSTVVLLFETMPWSSNIRHSNHWQIQLTWSVSVWISWTIRSRRSFMCHYDCWGKQQKYPCRKKGGGSCFEMQPSGIQRKKTAPLTHPSMVTTQMKM